MTSWETFFNEKVVSLFLTSGEIIDIGGGLRAIQNKGNRFDKSRAWIFEYIKKTNYKIMDPVPDFSPDIIGDIHKIPLRDESVDSIFCLAVLEHVEDPKVATSEMRRVLKKGGKALIYVPFLYYYHAEVGYYKDYWRFSKDAVALLFKEFHTMEICPSRGAIETLTKLSPFGRYKIFSFTARFFDKIFGKDLTNQVNGYYVYLEK